MNNRLKILLPLFLSLLYATHSEAQTRKIDSLFALLEKDKEDTIKFHHLSIFAIEQRNAGHFDTALFYSISAVKLAEKLKFGSGIASAYNNLGNVYQMMADYPRAFENAQKSLIAWEIILDQLKTKENSAGLFKTKKGISSAQNNIGNIYYRQGNFPLALEYYLKSLRIKEELLQEVEQIKKISEIREIQKAISSSYNNIGLIYDEQADYKTSLKYYLKALQISQQCQHLRGTATAYNNLGGVYHNEGKSDLALENYFSGLKIQRELNDRNAMAITYINVGNIYKEKAEYMQKEGLNRAVVETKLNDALTNYLNAHNIFKEIEDKHGLANSNNGIGSTYALLNKPKLGIEYCNTAVAIGKEIGSKTDLRNSYNLLSKIYLQLKDYKKAYETSAIYSLYHDSLLSNESSKHLGDLKTNYAVEKKEIEMRARHENERALAEADKKRQEIFFWLICSVALAVATIAFIVFRNLRLTRKQKAIIEGQKLIVEEQKKMVEAKQKEVLDSIQYAKRIQLAQIPTDRFFARTLERLRKK